MRGGVACLRLGASAESRRHAPGRLRVRGGTVRASPEHAYSPPLRYGLKACHQTVSNFSYGFDGASENRTDSPSPASGVPGYQLVHWRDLSSEDETETGYRTVDRTESGHVQSSDQTTNGWEYEAGGGLIYTDVATGDGETRLTRTHDETNVYDRVADLVYPPSSDGEEPRVWRAETQSETTDYWKVDALAKRTTDDSVRYRIDNRDGRRRVEEEAHGGKQSGKITVDRTSTETIHHEEETSGAETDEYVFDRNGTETGFTKDEFSSVQTRIRRDGEGENPQTSPSGDFSDGGDDEGDGGEGGDDEGDGVEGDGVEGDGDEGDGDEGDGGEEGGGGGYYDQFDWVWKTTQSGELTRSGGGAQSETDNGSFDWTIDESDGYGPLLSPESGAGDYSDRAFFGGGESGGADQLAGVGYFSIPPDDVDVISERAKAAKAANSWHWHHRLPQAIFTADALKEWGLSESIDIDDPKYGTLVQGKYHNGAGGGQTSFIHPDYDKAWKDWIAEMEGKGKPITKAAIDRQLQRLESLPKYKELLRGQKPTTEWYHERKARLKREAEARAKLAETKASKAGRNAARTPSRFKGAGLKSVGVLDTYTTLRDALGDVGVGPGRRTIMEGKDYYFADEDDNVFVVEVGWVHYSRVYVAGPQDGRREVISSETANVYKSLAEKKWGKLNPGFLEDTFTPGTHRKTLPIFGREYWWSDLKKIGYVDEEGEHYFPGPFPPPMA